MELPTGRMPDLIQALVAAGDELQSKEMRMKLVLFGAGSAQFGLGMLGDIFHSRILAGAEVTLVDIRPDALRKVHDLASEYVDGQELPFSVAATTDRRRALRGTDYVIISIEVGDRFALWDEDWKVPQQYGIRQVYGENGGPGGLFHALRIIPVIMAICDDIMELAPDAHVFCYSNPMTAITTAVHRKHPGIRFYGMCHEVASLERYLPAILDTPFENLAVRAAGLNHFSILVEARYRDSGRDAYPDILLRAPDFFAAEPGASEIWEYARKNGVLPYTEGARDRSLQEVLQAHKPWPERGLFKVILEKFRLLPITVDSHLGEYIPWAHDAVDHQSIVDFYDFYRHLLANVTPDISQRRHERAIAIIEGVITDIAYEEDAVNIPNKGFIPTLPDGIAVEVPAAVNGSGVQGVAFPDYPKAFAALLRNYVGVYDLTVDAALQESRDLAVQALLVNPLVTEFRRIDELVDVMIGKQHQWLGYLK